MHIFQLTLMIITVYEDVLSVLKRLMKSKLQTRRRHVTIQGNVS